MKIFPDAGVREDFFSGPVETAVRPPVDLAEAVAALNSFAGPLEEHFAENGDSEWAAPIRRYLSGELDPEGAAALQMHLALTDSYAGLARFGVWTRLWALQGGVSFAVEAVCRAFGITWYAPYYLSKGITSVVRDNDLNRVRQRRIGIESVRELMEEASERERAEALDTASGFRDTKAGRYVASCIAPDNRRWAEEALADLPETDVDAYFFAARHLVTAEMLPHVPDAFVRSWLSRNSYGTSLGDTAEQWGTAAVVLVRRGMKLSRDRAERLQMLRTLSRIGGEAAFRELVAVLEEPTAQTAALDLAAKEKDVAVGVLAEEILAGRGDGRKLAGLLEAVAGWEDSVDEATAKAVRAKRDETARPEADTSGLPGLLVDPPWKRPRKKTAAGPVVKGLKASAGTVLRWADGEYEAWLGTEPHGYNYSPSWIDDILAGRSTRWVPVVRALLMAEPEEAEEALAAWDGSWGYTYRHETRKLLARFGERAAPALVRLAASQPDARPALVPVRSLEAARAAARWYGQSKSNVELGWRWFERHGADGIALIVPDCLGTVKKVRRPAELALRKLLGSQLRDEVLRAADTYGEEVRALVGNLEKTVPDQAEAAKIVRRPKWLITGTLPDVLVEGREERLGPEQVDNLVAVVASAGTGLPVASLDAVREALDEDSLRDWSWEVFRAWVAADQSAPQSWPLRQLAYFGDDDTAAKLEPIIRRWPGESYHQRAVAGLEVLGAMGTERALAAIQGIAESAKFKAIKESAARQIERIAEGLGLTRDQLADRLVSTFGLDEDGGMTIDYGPRSFRVVFDENLVPLITDEKGKVRKSLPKPGKKDDGEVAERNRKRFSALKKDLRKTASSQIARLEKALVTQRTWDTDSFRRHLVDHPLMWHMARRLVWVAEAGEERIPFRLAEDRTPADVEDDEIDLPEEATVRLAHPMVLGREDRAAWAEVLADYEILQPFDQLGREIHELTEEERKTGALTRFEGRKVDIGHVLGLANGAWDRGAPQDGGVEPGIYFTFREGLHLCVGLNPGIAAGDPFWHGREHEISDCQFQTGTYGWWHPDDRVGPVPDDLDPVVVSEALGALSRLVDSYREDK
ncbi:DUF4132 domain-containing protein [Salininema proteolyticum]|uniref:DUF4132 domain-containing protein n=1 Tax=Salininema proteolyticum TaxID=1607685 RepID=A0ABV8TYC1_9ACTN